MLIERTSGKRANTTTTSNKKCSNQANAAALPGDVAHGAVEDIISRNIAQNEACIGRVCWNRILFEGANSSNRAEDCHYDDFGGQGGHGSLEGLRLCFCLRFVVFEFVLKPLMNER